MPQFVNETTIFNSPVQFNVLPRRNIDKIPMGSTSADVTNIEHFTTHNTVATTITSFAKGTNGQEIVVLGDGFTTIQENASIVTNLGDILLETGQLYRFVNFDEVWYYDCCNVTGGGGGVSIPLIVEGAVAGDKIAYFHNTDATGYGVRIQNDGPVTNYALKISDATGTGMFHAYGHRTLHLGPEGSAQITALLGSAYAQTMFSIESHTVNGDAGIILKAASFDVVSMLYQTGGDGGLRLSWNYKQPYDVNGSYGNPAYPQIQTQWETDGSFSINYHRKFATAAGTWDTGGKTWKIYGGGFQEGVGPYDARGEYVSMEVGNLGRGFEIGVANVTTGDFKHLFRMKGYDIGAAAIPTNPIYLWVNGALRNVQSFNDGLGHNVLYY